MSRKRLSPIDESGAEVVEFALCLPILLGAGLVIVQLCLVAFFAFGLEAQVSSATWNVRPAELVASTDQVATLKGAVCDGNVLKQDRLTVENLNVRSRSESSSTSLPDTPKNKDVGLTNYVHDKTLVEVSCDMTYEVPTIFSFAGVSDIPVSRHVERTLVDTDRVEVG